MGSDRHPYQPRPPKPKWNWVEVGFWFLAGLYAVDLIETAWEVFSK